MSLITEPEPLPTNNVAGAVAEHACACALETRRKNASAEPTRTTRNRMGMIGRPELERIVAKCRFVTAITARLDGRSYAIASDDDIPERRTVPGDARPSRR